MYLLNLNELKFGDIILATQHRLISKGIRIATRSKYSHAMLFVGNYSCIHSTTNGVHSINTQDLLFEDINDFAVYRLIPSIADKKMQIACDLARTQIGKMYSIKEAIRTKSPIKSKDIKNRQFCSRLIGQCFQDAGIKLVKEPNYCSPKEFEDSKKTYRIDNYYEVATAAQIDFANRDKTVIDNQEYLTNSILEQARSVVKEDIQTLEELTACLLEKNEFDLEITKIIQTSGYLKMMDKEIQKAPWRFDYNLFLELELSEIEKIDLAKVEKESAKEMKRRFRYMLDLYVDVYQNFSLHYIKMWIILYNKLLLSTDNRLDTMNKFLTSKEM